MVGYSGTPLPRKLGIQPGHRVLLWGAPPGFDAVLDPLPEPIQLATTARSRGPFDVIVLFAQREAVLRDRFAKAAARLEPNGGLWIAWPKQASGVETDLNGNVVRGFGLGEGLVDNKVCAIDDTWSGLRFVVRVADRPRGGKR